jgi:hypothetical protein
MELETLLEQYNEYRQRITVWKKTHGIFYNDIKRLENQLNKLYDEHTTVLVNYRRTRKTQHLDHAIDILKTAINLAKTFSKVELLASLSKR